MLKRRGTHALVSWRVWPTLTSYESSFVIMTGAENTWREVTLDSECYQTSQELINAINMAIYEENVTATYSVFSRRIVMNIPLGTSLHFNESLSSTLGIGYGRTVCTKLLVACFQ